jgi:UDP-2,3-diacylglucosamine pyrophosphatase LpxH
MSDGASLHDRLLAALLDAPNISDVLLVARLDDPRIGHSDVQDVRVFVPDLHLLTRRDEARYRYGFNCKAQLIGVLRGLKALRQELAPGEKLIVYQLGDYIDLWRQGTNDATKILEEHYDIHGHLTGSRSALDAWFLLGNHDVELPSSGGFRAWNRRYYFPLHEPRVLVTHGDVFDWKERFPDAFNRLFVYMFDPARDSNAYDLEPFQRTAKAAHGRKQYRQYIQAECHDLADSVSATIGLPDGPAWNVARVTDPGDRRGHEFLPASFRSVQEARARFGVGLTMAVIGHTHHARIAVYEGTNGEFFAVMDCGAWIERYRTPTDPEPRLNAQIGVMVGNDCRIYQIVGPRTA